MKRSILLFLQTAIPFGLGVSFIRCFTRNGTHTSAQVLLITGIVLILLSCPFSKVRKNVMDRFVKLQPLAAVVFAASIILSFMSYQKVWLQLFVTLVLNAVCLFTVFEKKNLFERKTFFLLTSFGALAGMGTAFAGRAVFLYVLFALSALLCRPGTNGKTAQDIWKDIAFPLFVLICSFVWFVSANHGGSVSAIIAQSVVMLMTGGLLMTSRSALRLTLMTIVMIVFGSYVFSAQNTNSVFNRPSRTSVRIQAPLQNSVPDDVSQESSF